MDKHYDKYRYYKDLYFKLKGGHDTFEGDRGEIKKIFSGAGILLLEWRNYQLTVILFKSIRKNVEYYEDLGGKIDKKDFTSSYPLGATAKREAFEESRGLINIRDSLQLAGLQYIDIEANPEKFYRAHLFLIPENSISRKDYLENKKKIDNAPHIPSFMKETEDIKWFYLKDFDKKKDSMRDVEGTQFRIFPRTARIMEKLLNMKLDQPELENTSNILLLKSLYNFDKPISK